MIPSLGFSIIARYSRIKHMIILKIGGSVITHKKTTSKTRTADIKRVAKEIKSALKKQPQSLILIHGAGGATHAEAKKYDLKKGAITPRQVFGAMQTHLIVAALQKELADIFLNEGVNVLPVYSGSYFLYDKNDNLISKNLLQLKTLAKNGTIPVLNGDMVPHEKKSFAILSGDKIAITMSKLFKVERVIFATDVDGFIDPKTKKLISKLDLKDLNKALIELRDYKDKDATGDLPGKLNEIAKKPKQTKIQIVNGLKKGRIESALKNKKVIGTEIR